jgi:hypothetical protein
MEKTRQYSALIWLALAFPAFAQNDIALPSGLAVAALDQGVEIQPGGARWLVLRYVAPSLAADAVGYPEILPDLDHLCATEGITIAEREGDIEEIVIVLLDRPVPRGTPDPEATQYIGGYMLADGQCEPE